MTDELFEFIIKTLIERADEAVKEEKEDGSDFNSGRVMGYYEVLDIIKNRLEIYDYDLSKCGLDINLEERY